MTTRTPDIDTSDLSSSDALEAARVCVWVWDADTRTLSIRASGASVLPEIEGEWQLKDLTKILDGLSGTALCNALEPETPSDDEISVELGLAKGGTLRLLGARGSPKTARGLVFATGNSAVPAIEIDLEPVYQPIIRLRDGSIAGFEALARWRDPEGNLQPVSELSHLGNPLAGARLALNMLEGASTALARWHEKYESLNLFVQVNLTGADLFRGDVLERVSSIVQSELFPSNALRVELTEQMAFRDFDAGVAAAVALQASGVALVLDDFGSGYSSLAWLASIPAVGIKLDPQLTQLPPTPRVDSVLSGIARLARSLGMSITAEGIEDFDRVQFLRGIGCDYVQGFAYARPMSFEAATKFLGSQKQLEELKT